ncbi:hypothetical protein SAMN05444503_101349 [Pseudomonas sp. BS3767]|uniref:Uncharacterized protein n=1 Tax=Pseudomonas syringae TaxID=317 RepID=A0AB37ZJ96_PSESX|nr:hypothetical protein SAMN05444503_101349 [Pseudomonas sp. BS3767]SDM63924.1 hypothetical protein SAMN05444505_103543 [Pseudomonas syringae]
MCRQEPFPAEMRSALPRSRNILLRIMYIMLNYVCFYVCICVAAFTNPYLPFMNPDASTSLCAC